jgi:hypothetical protein
MANFKNELARNEASKTQRFEPQNERPTLGELFRSRSGHADVRRDVV